MQKYDEVLAAISANNGLVLNDHKSSVGTIRPWGIAALVLGDKCIPVALCDSKYFCLNLMYVEDGKAHVSRDAVGGVVIPQDYDMNVGEAIRAYNHDQDSNRFSSGRLEHVVQFIYAGEEGKKTFHVLEVDEHGRRTGEVAMLSSKHTGK